MRSGELTVHAILYEFVFTFQGNNTFSTSYLAHKVYGFFLFALNDQIR